ncbi:hypothetical protein BDZ89DRAFT_483547 [Hymenopellis radicata]|nr:hypothetical protein BDZ89DRAFT_483547 [Hymenopellis radicata]
MRMDALSSDGTFHYHGVVAAFDTLVVIGFVMIAIVLVPAWRSSEIYRLKTWFALMIAGLVHSVSFFLVVGRQFGEEPAFGLCLLQASLIYGAPVLAFSPYWVLLFPTFCIVISIIFGTQKDILKFYRDLFVKRTKNRDSLRLIPDALEMPIRQSAKDDFLDV